MTDDTKGLLLFIAAQGVITGVTLLIFWFVTDILN